MGHKSVQDCQEAISSNEFATWQAYDQLEPILPPWHVYFGTVVAAITNTMRSKKSDRVWSWQDFFPMFDYEKPNQSVEDQIAIVEMFNEAFGGIDLRDKKPSIA